MDELKKSLGITIYPFQNFDVEKNQAYIKMAFSYGYTRVFLSFFCAEPAIIKTEDYQIKIKEITSFANALGMHIQADFFPEIFEAFQATPTDLKRIFECGINEIRIDYGFSFKEMAEISKHEECNKIIINASELYDEDGCLVDVRKTFTKGIRDYIDAGGILEKIEVSNNMYPREGTGLAMQDLLDKIELFSSYGIPVSAFCNSQTFTYTLFHAMDGSPTVESHRKMSAYASAHELFASNAVQSVFIADGFISECELQSLQKILKEDSIGLRIQFYKESTMQEINALLQGIHVNRGAAMCMRSMLVRGKCLPLARKTSKRKAYDVTIDNESYGRYAGEIQILFTDRDQNDRVNIVAKIMEEDVVLLPYVTAGKKFHFICMEEENEKTCL